MIDSLDERLALANPVLASSLGELRPDVARELVTAIVGRRARRRRPAVRRLALVVLVALAVAAPVAFAAARTHLLDFALGDPAPKSVQDQLERMLPQDFGRKENPREWSSRKDIILSSERLVGVLKTSTGATARMYAVQLRGGGACWFATGRPFNGGGCGGRALHRTSTIGGSIGMLFAGMGKREAGTFGQGVTLFGPVGAQKAATIRVAYKDGQEDSIPVRNGWFMYEVPLAHTHWGHEPTTITVLGASGNALASRNDPFGLHPPPRPKLEQALEPHELLKSVSLGYRGASIQLLLATGSEGNQCLQVRNTSNLQTRRWICGPEVGRSTPGLQPPSKKLQPVYLTAGRLAALGKPGGYVYFSGWAGPPVAGLEIRFQDSTVEKLPLDRRFFVYVVPKTRWMLGRRPSYLIGRNAAGAVLYRHFLYPAARCTFPVRDPRCSQTVFHAG